MTQKMPSIAETLSASTRPPRPQRFKLCRVCGEMYDTKHIGEAYHHAHEDGRDLPFFSPDAR